MGIDLYCDKAHFGCGYGNWNLFRIHVIQASILYLENLFSNIHFDTTKFNLDDKTYDYEGETYKNILTNFLLLATVSVEKVELKYNNALIHFGIGGLYSFCQKNDCEGYYSVGNAYDICQLFRTIRPFLPDDETKETMDRVLLVFEESVQSQKKISIT